MALTFVAAIPEVTGNPTANFGAPAGTSQGDVMLVAIYGFGFGPIGVPSGWTVVASDTGNDMVVSYHIYQPSDGTYTFTSSSALIVSGGVWSGNVSAPVDAASIANFNVTASANTENSQVWSIPAVATTRTNDLIVCLVTGNQTAGSGYVAADSPFTLLAGGGDAGSVLQATQANVGSPSTAYTVTLTTASGGSYSAIFYGCIATVALFSEAPPSAPSGLSPNSGSVSNSVAETLSWIFSSPMPGDSQAGFSAQYSSNGGSSWATVASSTTLSAALVSGTAYTSLAVAALTSAVASGDSIVLTSGTNTQTFTASAAAAVGATSISVTSLAANFAYPIGAVANDTNVGSVSSFVIPANTLPAAQIQWQVQVTSALTGLTSAYSTLAYFQSAAPTAAPTITSPTANEVISANAFTVTWSAASQTSYEVRTVADNAGSPNTSTVYYDSGIVVSTQLSASVPLLTNKLTEHVEVRVEANGLWSAWADVIVSVSYTVPPVPSLLLTPNNATASIAVAIDNNNNLLSAVDASFESGVGDWHSFANAIVAQTTAQALDGTHSLAVEAVASGAVIVGTSNSSNNGVPVNPGESYLALGWSRAGSAGEPFSVAIGWLSSSGDSLGQTAYGLPTTDTSSGWSYATQSGVAPAGAAWAFVLAEYANAAGQLAAPSAPTVTPEGTAGTTTYSYEVVASNSNGSTTPSPPGTTTTGNATLSSTNYNLVAWSAVPLPAGSPGNLVYDSNLTNAIAAVGPTWGFTTGNAAGQIGTGDGDWNVINPGTNSAAIEYIGTGSAEPAGTFSTSQPVPVTAGATMTLSALMDATNLLAGDSLVLTIIYNGNLNNAIGSITQRAGSKGTLSLTFQVPSGATTVSVIPWMALYGSTSGASAGLPVSWSQIQLTETSTVQPYEPGPLFTYDVYREVSGIYESIGTTTALAFEDTGQAGGAAPPTANTSGETHYIDEAGLFAGAIGNLVYDSNLAEAIAAVGPTWTVNAVIGTANGNWNVNNPGTTNAGFVYYGTGSAASATYLESQSISVTPGATYTLAGIINASAVTAGNPLLYVFDANTLTTIVIISQSAGASAGQSVSFQVPTGTTAVKIGITQTNATVTAGAELSWSQIQLTETSTVQPYAPGPLWTPGGSVLSNDLYRFATAAGVGTAERIATGLAANATYVDYTPASGVDYQYQANAIGPLGNTASVWQD